MVDMDKLSEMKLKLALDIVDNVFDGKGTKVVEAIDSYTDYVISYLMTRSDDDMPEVSENAVELEEGVSP